MAPTTRLPFRRGFEAKATASLTRPAINPHMTGQLSSVGDINYKSTYHFNLGHLRVVSVSQIAIYSTSYNGQRNDAAFAHSAEFANCHSLSERQGVPIACRTCSPEREHHGLQRFQEGVCCTCHNECGMEQRLSLAQHCSPSPWLNFLGHTQCSKCALFPSLSSTVATFSKQPVIESEIRWCCPL